MSELNSAAKPHTSLEDLRLLATNHPDTFDLKASGVLKLINEICRLQRELDTARRATQPASAPACPFCGVGDDGSDHAANCYLALKERGCMAAELAAAWGRRAGRADSAPAETQHRGCNNPDCTWEGSTHRMLGGVGPLCPECGETTELIAVGAPQGQAEPAGERDRGRFEG